MTQYVGIDLSLGSSGLAMLNVDAEEPPVRVAGHAFRGHNDVYTKLVTSKPKATGPAVEKKGKLVRTQTYDDKLRRFQQTTADIETWLAPDAVVFLEGPSYASTGQSVHDIAGNWWHLYHRLEQRGTEIHVIAPSVVKQYATGKGNAAKDHVMAAVIKRYPDIDVTGNDVADAVVLLALNLRVAGHPLEIDLPATHLKALATLHP
jgi:crossover junction endodeoxyribonuclease RuvC